MKTNKTNAILKSKHLIPAIIFLFFIWIIFIVYIIRFQSVYDIVGPTENPYWGIAQFRIASDEFRNSLLKYKISEQNNLDKVRFDYEILVSKFFVISQRSETTKSAYQQPLYSRTVDDLRRSFLKMDVLMDELPNGGERIANAMIEESTVFVTAYDQFVGAVGFSEVRRRDAHLAETLRNRSILLYSNIGVSLLFFIAILTFLRSARYFEKTLQTARQVAHTKQVFLASINHELRNPLQTIVSATENISHYATNRELMCAVTNIDQAVRHIETHMRDLTDYLRLRTHKINLRVCSVDLKEITSEVIRRFKPKASEKGIRLQANFDGPTTRFRSDGQRVQQILDNLVENSIKYSSGGVVQIRCSIFPDFLGNGVKVQVIDEGIGIEKNKIEFLFSPFYQSPLNENSPVSGYGMGLAVVRGLVEVLGGSIAVESDVGKGAVFTVKLPYETRLIKHASSLPRPDSELIMPADQEW
ncbi:sensor histidine kinase [Burkholderia pyrrocinia]|uniref:sensor histidine kinase n=2 Tax=Burkholderia cepacia complex TaxID=87882 RepID=UPI00064C25F8|nr:HAMP domain-containing sensor histidine kinase [Burkholderia pyrrocinia]AKM02694.1 hypothetical protein ABD05_21060 [Burkholderia pyrrocinia]